MTEDVKLSPSNLDDQPEEKRFCGLSRTFYIGGYITSITNFIVNTILLSFAFGIPGFSLALIVDVTIILPFFCMSWVGLCYTTPNIPEDKGSWKTLRVVICATVFYLGIFITILAYKVTLPGDAVCPDIRPETQTESDYLQHCAWYHHKNIFYVHAFTGPAVLALQCFNYMKTSRGLLFPIAMHRYIGRINNILVLICSIGAFGIAMKASSGPSITSGFFILLAYWVPTMLLGWYFAIVKNINQHTRFMTRHFTGTCGAITLRLLGLLQAPYIVCVWGCLVQLFIVEWYLQKQDDCDKVFLNAAFRRWNRLDAISLPTEDSVEMEKLQMVESSGSYQSSSGDQKCP